MNAPHRTAMTVAACAALGAVALAPADAADPVGPRPPEARPAQTSDLTEAGTYLTRAAPDASSSLVTDRSEERVAPGLRHIRLETYDAQGWRRTNILKADLGNPALTLDYASTGEVSKPGKLSDALRREGGVAGINGDFFDGTGTKAPLGVGVDREDGVLHGPSTGEDPSFVITADEAPHIMDAYIEATISVGGGETLQATNLNSPITARNGINVVTPVWGTDALDHLTGGSPQARQVVVADGVVTSNSTTVDHEGPIPEGTVVLVARGDTTAQLAGLEKGTKVDVTYDLRDLDAKVAIGGRQPLLSDGQVVAPDDDLVHPRTAIGVDDDTGTVVMMTVDGRQEGSRGATVQELARLMKQQGADDALNLDGGGSSTMIARSPGEESVLVNTPSDGKERPIPNGLGFKVADGSNHVTGVSVRPLVDDDLAPRVFPGLRRSIVAHPFNERLDRVSRPTAWGTSSPKRLRVPETTGTQVTVQGLAPGRAKVTASTDHDSGAAHLRVLGRLARIDTDVEQVALTNADDTGSFVVQGFDRQGWSTWIDPRDVELTYDTSKLKITHDDQGFTVQPLQEDGSAVVTATVDGKVTRIGVSMGLEPTSLSSMDDESQWGASSFPSVVKASVSPTEGHSADSGQAMQLDYDLSGTTATRAAYLDAKPALPIPGSPQRIGMWVRGDGKGAWLRMNVKDGAGVMSTLDLALKVDWEGWRYVSAEVPAGLSRPLTFVRAYVVETDASREYSGSIAIDDITAEVAPTVDVPPAPTVQDPTLVTDGRIGAGRWRVAVMSDGQFTSDDPTSDTVAQVRRTMREMVAADPAFVVIAGDLVDRAFDGDMDLAQKVIDEELEGKVPWHYVPGNHEASGSGDLSTFTERFGDPVTTFDRRGTRFVLLNSALGSLRAGGFEQVVMLREQLTAAASDPDVDNVVVVAHHPTEDPAVTDNSELTDQLEARLIERWLSDFRVRSDKGAAYVSGHAGLFHASHVDGVSYLVNGNSGKAPSAAPHQGGFTGWTMLGLASDRTTAGPWLLAEMRPHVDEIAFDGPGQVKIGSAVRVDAVVRQGERQVPVEYPVAANWVGRSGLYVGPRAQAPSWARAVYSPGSDRLVGIKAGKVRLRVSVGGTVRTTTFTVRR